MACILLITLLLTSHKLLKIKIHVLCTSLIYVQLICKTTTFYLENCLNPVKKLKWPVSIIWDSIRTHWYSVICTHVPRCLLHTSFRPVCSVRTPPPSASGGRLVLSVQSSMTCGVWEGPHQCILGITKNKVP